MELFKRLTFVATGDRTPISACEANALPLSHLGVANLTSWYSYSDSNLKKYHILQVSLKGRFQAYATVIWLKYCRYGVNTIHSTIQSRRILVPGISPPYPIPTYLGPWNIYSLSNPDEFRSLEYLLPSSIINIDLTLPK